MIGAVAIVAVGATGAFFSDTETSTGNTFTAGAIDLGVDNESYYNGHANAGTSWDLDFDIDTTEFSGDNQATTEVENGYSLPIVRQFFNFLDLKPGDYGEDTISIHVNNNPSWLCADVRLVTNDDATCNEPENDVEGTNCALGSEPDNDFADGDLAQNIDFLWWNDDGDNVLEIGEQTLSAGLLGNLGVGNTARVALVDSDENIFGTQGQPFPGATTEYIGKAWCFGDISALPLLQSSAFPNVRATTTPAQDGDGNGTAGQPTDGGYTCSGASSLNNASQTDSTTLDIGFRAVQSRNNVGFQCQTPLP